MTTGVRLTSAKEHCKSCVLCTWCSCVPGSQYGAAGMCCLSPVSPEKESQMSVSKMYHLTKQRRMNCEHSCEHQLRGKQDLYMEKKGQLTTETEDGMFNNARMRERCAQIRFMQTHLDISENTSTCVCSSTSHALLQVSKPAILVLTVIEYNWEVVYPGEVLAFQAEQDMTKTPT